MRILVTGARKGLGAFLCSYWKEWECDAFTRGTWLLPHSEYDVVVHCAFNTKNNPSDCELAEYFQDNIILTHELLKIQAKRFVFISSIDVYPEDHEYKTENDDIDINSVRNIYGQCKLVCEDMVSRHDDYLILRCGGIIGPNKIPRSITNIIENRHSSLTKNSTVNYVHQKTIADLIMTPDVQRKTVNVVSDESMTISEMEELYPGITYGLYEYHATNVSTIRLKKLFPNVKIPSSKNTLLSVLGNT